MIRASRFLHHSSKLKHTHNAIRKDHATLVRWFTNHARASVDNKDNVPRSSPLGHGLRDEHGTSRFPHRGSSSSCQQLINQTTVSTVRMDKGTILCTAKKIQGNIAKWWKKEGEKLSPGEVLCEVETDKATVEMECMEEGYLAKIVQGDGSTGIKVGEIIAITVEEEEDAAKFEDYSPSTSDAAASSKEPSPKEEVPEVVASPPEPKVSKPSEPSSAGDQVFVSPLTSVLAEDQHGKVDTTSAALDYTDIPQTQIRKVTASRLSQSKQTIPHYYLTVDTCVDKLMELRSYLNSMQEASGGKRISINDLVIKAASLALRDVPQCNSSWADNYIRQYHNVNINVAVQTDDGLYVPVIRDADKKGLSRISEEVMHLAQKAKENSLKPKDFEGGTFTVSNLGGPFGIKQFCAIVNPPQSGILAVGSAENRAIPGSGLNQCELGSFMSATLSCDHRVIDGAIGAKWLKAFKGYIENPRLMLL